MMMAETEGAGTTSNRGHASGFIMCERPGCGSFHVPTRHTEGRVQYRKCSVCGWKFKTVKPEGA